MTSTPTTAFISNHDGNDVKNNIMGGHAAWRKRVERGQLAKQSSGAICRHRPHLGAKGKEAILKNKRGSRAGGNPKKRRKGKQHDDAAEHSCTQQDKDSGSAAHGAPVALLLAVIGAFVIGFSSMMTAGARSSR
jgi:hypothetical protein